MLLSEPSGGKLLANGICSMKRPGKLLVENGECSNSVSVPKYKRRKISAVRDFPPGCGRYAQRLILIPTKEPDSVVANGHENSNSDERIGGRGGGESNGTHLGLSEDLQEVVAATLRDDVIPLLADGTFFLPSNGIVDVSKGDDGLVKRARNYPPRRKISVVRDFPPNCGRNVHLLIAAGVVNGCDSPVNKNLVTENLDSGMDDKKLSTEVMGGDEERKKSETNVVQNNKSDSVKNEKTQKITVENDDIRERASKKLERSGTEETRNSAQSKESDMKDKAPNFREKVDGKKAVEDVNDGDVHKHRLEKSVSDVNKDVVTPYKSAELLVSQKNNIKGKEKLVEPRVVDKFSTVTRKTVRKKINSDAQLKESWEWAEVALEEKTKDFGQGNSNLEKLVDPRAADKFSTVTKKTARKKINSDDQPKESWEWEEVALEEKTKGFGQGISDLEKDETLAVDMTNYHLKQTVDSNLVRDSHKRRTKEHGRNRYENKVHPESEEKVAGEDEFGVKMGVEVEKKLGEPPFEDKLVWWDHEFDTVAGEDDNDEVRASGDELGMEKFNRSEAKFVNEKQPDRVVAQGSTASPSSPRKQGKSGGREEKKPDTTSPVLAKKTKMTARKQVDENISRQTSLKKTFPKKAESQFFGDKDKSGDRERKEHLVVAPVSRSTDVYFPPFHPSVSSKNGGTSLSRYKVKETLRLYQCLCRKYTQEDEILSKVGKSIKRVDLKAYGELKRRGKLVNQDSTVLGPVPGVEVGDEYQYRAELNIIGLHRHIQGGIHYTKYKKKDVATSIVASGGYSDDLDNSEALIYSGQGGNVMKSGKEVKEPEDQKLIRGNLALKNSMDEQTPVRVIRGHESADGKSKTYMYDGLYLVEKYWQEVGSHGKLVFQFRLVRIPGQPELAWKEAKKRKKNKAREGIIVDDISNGKEAFPICAVNTVDNEKPPVFKYVTKMIYPDWYKPSLPEGCSCTTKCSDSAKCLCAVKNGGEIPFNHNGAIVEVKPLVFECGPNCRCSNSCYNRVSQHGIKFPLEIFKTGRMGWGVRSIAFIASGSFVCEYVGELLKESEAERRTGNDEYLFDIGRNYNDNTLWDDDSGDNAAATQITSVYSDDATKDGSFTIDAAVFGNIGRFINHSCTPNLYAQNVIFDHDDYRIPRIMLFAAENIPAMQELTYHYNYDVGKVRDSNGSIKKKSCFCGSHECTGRLY